MKFRLRLFEVTLVFGVLSCAALLGCGAGSPSSTNQLAGQATGTTFTATLQRANNAQGFTQGATGSAGNVTVTIDPSNMIRVVVNAQGLSPNTMIAQHIHSGTRCATAADDTNGDGYIDAVEGEAASGTIVVPLDIGLTLNPATTNKVPGP